MKSAPWCTAVVVAASACGDLPTLPRATSPLYEIVDGAHNSGNARFYFLPPLVRQRTFSGVFDGTLSPVVEVCDLATCGTAAVATFTTNTGPGSENVRVNLSEQNYVVNWPTRDFDLDADRTYRVRVLVSQIELGHADVEVVSGGKAFGNRGTHEFVAVRDGRTLPIKFRIEEGALPVTLVKVSGDGQLGNEGEALESPLVVQAVNASGAGVAGVKVMFETQDDIPNLLAELTTDELGLASLVVTLGSSGIQLIRASVPNLEPVVFEVTSLATEPSVTEPSLHINPGDPTFATLPQADGSVLQVFGTRDADGMAQGITAVRRFLADDPERADILLFGNNGFPNEARLSDGTRIDFEVFSEQSLLRVTVILPDGTVESAIGPLEPSEPVVGARGRSVATSTSSQSFFLHPRVSVRDNAEQPVTDGLVIGEWQVYTGTVPLGNPAPFAVTHSFDDIYEGVLPLPFSTDEFTVRTRALFCVNLAGLKEQLCEKGLARALLPVCLAFVNPAAVGFCVFVAVQMLDPLCEGDPQFLERCVQWRLLDPFFKKELTSVRVGVGAISPTRECRLRFDTQTFPVTSTIVFAEFAIVCQGGGFRGVWRVTGTDRGQDVDATVFMTQLGSWAWADVFNFRLLPPLGPFRGTAYGQLITPSLMDWNIRFPEQTSARGNATLTSGNNMSVFYRFFAADGSLIGIGFLEGVRVR